MSAEEDVLKIIEDQLGGVVFIAVYLFEDDAPFLVDLMLREGAVDTVVSLTGNNSGIGFLNFVYQKFLESR